MEELVEMFKQLYKDRKVLVTGHTGFKGSWLSLWLDSLGAKVFGISLPAESGLHHWDLLGLDLESQWIDIRDANLLRAAINKIQPDIVFHLAAQSIVRRSYKNPLDTWSTNVMGTANLLDACCGMECLKGIVVVSTDKCYENKEWDWGYREIEPLGGRDPYSASKAGVELVTSSYRDSFFDLTSKTLVATARAGNVIGGGDWSEDRLMPDIVRSIETNSPLLVRCPAATRPWQHVLDCLSGYLLLGEKLLESKREFAEAWNFGPEVSGNRRVSDLLEAVKRSMPNFAWNTTISDELHEAKLLYLDSSKAREKLNWKPVWSFSESIEMTINWYKNWLFKGEVMSLEQIYLYCKQAEMTETTINASRNTL